MTGDPDETDRRPHRRRKLWRLAFALCLASPIVYVLSGGPAAYSLERGWMSGRAFEATYGPLLSASPQGTAHGEAVAGYLAWWLSLAGRHEDRRPYHLP